MKFLFSSILFIVCFCWVSQFCLKRTDKFSVAEVLSERPFSSKWDVRPLRPQEQEEVERALNQTYTYLGKGGQSFIFFSEDAKYALKLFKQSKFTLPFWMEHFPIPWLLDRYIGKKKRSRAGKIERDFCSYKMAFEELQDETGLVYVHLNKTDIWKRKLRIVDRLNIAHTLDVDGLDFVLQRRAQLIYPHIDQLMRENNEIKAKECISRVLELVAQRCKKGFYDGDPNIRTNCGLLEGRAIKIDVGRFARDEKMKEPEVLKEEVERICAPFKVWLEEYHCSLVSYLDEQLKKLM